MVTGSHYGQPIHQGLTLQGWAVKGNESVIIPGPASWQDTAASGKHNAVENLLAYSFLHHVADIFQL